MVMSFVNVFAEYTMRWRSCKHFLLRFRFL